MKYCLKCGKGIAEEAAFCNHCGTKIKVSKKKLKNLKGNSISMKKKIVYEEEEDEKPSCPFCGSSHLQAVTEGHTKGYSAGSGCCGAILFGPLGLLCGANKLGESHQHTKRMCLKCGRKF